MKILINQLTIKKKKIKKQWKKETKFFKKKMTKLIK